MKGTVNGFVSINELYDKLRVWGQEKHYQGKQTFLYGSVGDSVEVWHLAPPTPEFGAAVTYISAVDDNGSRVSYLINCGASDYSVSKFLVPALKAIGVDITKINFLLFTNCDPSAIGGVHKVKQLAENIQVVAAVNQTKYIKNPSYRFMKKWGDFLDYSPPFRELRGILPDATCKDTSSSGEKSVFPKLTPLFMYGTSEDNVTWYCAELNLMVCGDALQANGTVETGIACYNSLPYYRASINSIYEKGLDIILTNKDYTERLSEEEKERFSEQPAPCVILGRNECRQFINLCQSYTAKYAKYIDAYSSKYKVKKENINVEHLVEEYFKNNPKPEMVCYALQTFDNMIDQSKSNAVYVTSR